MKRFYKLVSVSEAQGRYSILLDGKPVKTPARNILLTDNRKLADALLGEWAAQKDNILPETMPLTQILSTCIDRVSAEREAMTQTLMKYLDTDLLCYRAGPPPDIGPLQEAAWDPWLVWFEREFGTKLQTTRDLKALQQPRAARDAVKNYIKTLEDEIFTVLQLAVSLSGSLVLGLAFIKQAIAPEDIFAAARVEEQHKAKLYNEEQYGPDPMQAKKDAEILKDLRAATQFLQFIKSGT